MRSGVGREYTKRGEGSRDIAVQEISKSQCPASGTEQRRLTPPSQVYRYLS